MTMPNGYPLPWCEELDLPWWKVNMIACMTEEGWSEKQRGMKMDDIIPLLGLFVERIKKERVSV